jgi:hypothetical protein
VERERGTHGPVQRRRVVTHGRSVRLGWLRRRSRRRGGRWSVGNGALYGRSWGLAHSRRRHIDWPLRWQNRAAGLSVVSLRQRQHSVAGRRAESVKRDRSHRRRLCPVFGRSLNRDLFADHALLTPHWRKGSVALSAGQYGFSRRRSVDWFSLNTTSILVMSLRDGGDLRELCADSARSSWSPPQARTNPTLRSAPSSAGRSRPRVFHRSSDEPRSRPRHPQRQLLLSLQLRRQSRRC